MIDTDKINELCGVILGCKFRFEMTNEKTESGIDKGITEFKFYWDEKGQATTSSSYFTAEFIKHSNIPIEEAVDLDLERKVSIFRGNNEQSI